MAAQASMIHIRVDDDLKEQATVGMRIGVNAGALQSAGYLAALAEAGFQRAEVVAHFESFAGTRKEKVARKHGVRGANFIAFKD